MTRRGLSRYVLAGAFGLLSLVTLALSACNSPFIPIPPPGDPTFTPIASADGTTWETRGQPTSEMAGARVYVFNQKLGVGVIARAGQDGAYVASPIDGEPGDPIEISYENPKGERSAPICRPLQAGLVRTPCP